MVLYFNVLMEKMMKKVCFVFVVLAAMFLNVACDGNTKLEDLIDTDVNDTEAVDTDATDPADTADTDADSDADTDADTDINDTDVNDTDVNDTDVNDTDVNDTDVNDTDVNDTDVNDTDPTEPTTEPTEPTTDPTEPTTEPTDPTTEPTTEPTEPTTDPTNPTDPTEPTDPTVVEPCNPNQCLSLENSDGVCTPEGDSFTCGCNEGYLWYEGDCEKVVTQSFCATLAQVLGFEGTLAELVEAVCHCFSADQCVIEVEIEVEL